MHNFFTLILTVVLIAGCNRSHNEPHQLGVQKSVLNSAVEAEAIAHYNCPPSVHVDLLPEDKMYVTVPGQQSVILEKIQYSAPETFVGANLYFTITGDIGYLSQQNGTEIRCYIELLKDQ